jgi:hypothetical protein
VLTLDDLANRADRAYTDHLEGYTASAVLHQLYMGSTVADEELREALDQVFLRLAAYHADTRARWRRAHGVWATAAGVEPDPDDVPAAPLGYPGDLPGYDAREAGFADEE